MLSVHWVWEGLLTDGLDHTEKKAFLLVTLGMLALKVFPSYLISFPKINPLLFWRDGQCIQCWLLVFSEPSGGCCLHLVHCFPWIPWFFYGTLPVLSRSWIPLCLISYHLSNRSVLLYYWHLSIAVTSFPILLVLTGLCLFNSYTVILVRVVEKGRLMFVFNLSC